MRPVSIEVGNDPNNKEESHITITSKDTDNPYMDSLTDCVMGFCDWVTRIWKCEADCIRENNQVICTLQMPRKDLAVKVMPELRNRLWRYENRVAATAGVLGFERGRRMTMQSSGGGRRIGDSWEEGEMA